MKFEVTYDDRQFQELLDAWQEPNVKKTLRKGASAWGKAGKPILKAHTPVGPSGRPKYGGVGSLQASVRYKRMKSRYGIGVVVANMGRAAFVRHMVEYGTADHLVMPKSLGGRLATVFGPRPFIHSHAKPHPFIGPAAGEVERAGAAAAEVVIFGALAEAHPVVDEE